MQFVASLPLQRHSRCNTGPRCYSRSRVLCCASKHRPSADLSSSPPPVPESAHESNGRFRRNVVSVPHLSDYLSDLVSNKNPARRRPEVQQHFVSDHELVRGNIIVNDQDNEEHGSDEYFLRAGPRQTAYYRRENVRAAIVTCGGLCPGINCTIREIVRCLELEYGVKKIFGIRNGYQGCYKSHWIELNAGLVDNIHKSPGTLLGTSRGGFDLCKIVDALETRSINQLYVIGGDGTICGAHKIVQEVMRRKLRLSVAVVPKTIDNDIETVSSTFGFATAVEESQRAISAAAIEARDFPNGVAIVQLMGRNSGFIAMHATLASREVDACLIPEIPFPVHGKGGVLDYINELVREKGHAIVVVAEGAGSDDYDGSSEIGAYLRDEVKEFAKKNWENRVSMKYLNPTYSVRAVPTIASDRIFCTLLAHDSVHGVFSGLTGFVTGPIHSTLAYIPLSRIAGRQKKVDPSDLLWLKLMSSTGQPDWTKAKAERREMGVKAESGS